MRSRSRRSTLKRAGAALGATLGGCLGGPDSVGSRTDSATSSEPAGTECQDGPTEDSWERTGSWNLDGVVTNDDAVAYTVTLDVHHRGTEPCHHAESSPCQMPEKSVEAFERTFELEADGSRAVSDVTLDLWEDWIDDYTVRVRIENGDTTARESVFAYETGAKEPVGADEYDRADFYVSDGADRTVDSTISNGAPNTTH